MWAKAEVLDSLTCVLRATEEDNVRASWCAHGELIEGKALATGLLDASAGGSSEAECADGHLGHLVETVVVSDRGHDCADLALKQVLVVAVGGHRDNLGDREWCAVHARHPQAAEDGVVELRVGTAGQEAVQLVQQLHVWVVALGGLAVAALDVVGIQIYLVDCQDIARVVSLSMPNVSCA